MSDLDVGQEIAAADSRLAINNRQLEMPLDITIRSIALTVAERYCGDITVKEGNLYQHLKMDNKLAGPLTLNQVIHAALVFEMYLWGKWSQDIAGKAMETVFNELDQAIKDGALDKEIERRVGDLEDDKPVTGLEDEPNQTRSGNSVFSKIVPRPTRPHGGE